MPFWQFLRNRLNGWIGHALLVQPSKMAHGIFFSLLYLIFSFIFLNTKPLSKVAPGLLFIQIQIQAVCRSKQSYYCTTIRPFEMHCRSFLIFQLKGFKKHNTIIKFIKALQKHFIIVLCFLKPFLKAC